MAAFLQKLTYFFKFIVLIFVFNLAVFCTSNAESLIKIDDLFNKKIIY
ncbi:hypothetical protein NURINAE_01480 [Candidatus Nitrosacidococcus sp. I8]|nr:hypothetical protein NURINAE_01480 [Candidatus Nitrosacidococcus sp. I8]